MELSVCIKEQECFQWKIANSLHSVMDAGIMKNGGIFIFQRDSMLQRIKELICRHFGHKFGDTDALFFDIECNAYYWNLRHPETPRIQCKRCGKLFVPKNWRPNRPLYDD